MSQETRDLQAIADYPAGSRLPGSCVNVLAEPETALAALKGFRGTKGFLADIHEQTRMPGHHRRLDPSTTGSQSASLNLARARR